MARKEDRAVICRPLKASCTCLISQGVTAALGLENELREFEAF